MGLHLEDVGAPFPLLQELMEDDPYIPIAALAKGVGVSAAVSNVGCIDPKVDVNLVVGFGQCVDCSPKFSPWDSLFTWDLPSQDGDVRDAETVAACRGKAEGGNPK